MLATERGGRVSSTLRTPSLVQLENAKSATTLTEVGRFKLLIVAPKDRIEKL